MSQIKVKLELDGDTYIRLTAFVLLNKPHVIYPEVLSFVNYPKGQNRIGVIVG